MSNRNGKWPSPTTGTISNCLPGTQISRGASKWTKQVYQPYQL